MIMYDGPIVDFFFFIKKSTFFVVADKSPCSSRYASLIFFDQEKVNFPSHHDAASMVIKADLELRGKAITVFICGTTFLESKDYE